MTQEIARLRIDLEHLEPRIWRRVAVSLTTNLRSLHEVVQAVMPWENTHLYQFTIGDRVYGEPGPEDAAGGRKIYQAKGMRLGTLSGRGVTEFLYTYDFGDDWQHRIGVSKGGGMVQKDPSALAKRVKLSSQHFNFIVRKSLRSDVAQRRGPFVRRKLPYPTAPIFDWLQLLDRILVQKIDNLKTYIVLKWVGRPVND